LKKITVGTAMIPKRRATCCDSSTSTFAIVTLSPYSPARATIVGSSALHGPHQVAPKSSSAGFVPFSTVSVKFPSLT
jgi:hypothetical protein